MGSPITYGPAVTKRGHIPVQFRSLPPGQSGREEPDSYISSLITSLFSNPSLLKSQLKSGTIVIDPNSSDIHSPSDVQTSIRHEDTHGILESLGESAIQASQDSPGYAQIAQALMQANRGGRMAQEVPAYVASNDPVVKVDPIVKATFWKGYMDHIRSLDPKVAKQLQSMGPGQPPAGFGAEAPSEH